MEKEFKEQDLNNRDRISRSTIQRAYSKRRNILMMKETLNEARRGYIESRLAEYTAEVLRRGDPSSCLFFLREFRGELSEADIKALETIIGGKSKESQFEEEQENG